MIEKLTNYGLPGNLDQRATVPSSFSGPASPFHDLLKNEMNSSSSLEKMVLDFLIKTIESILSKTDQTGSMVLIFQNPFSGGGLFATPPGSEKPVIRNRSRAVGRPTQGTRN